MKKLRIVQIGTGHDHATAAAQTLKNMTDFEFVGYANVPEDNVDNSANPAFSGIKRVTVDELWELAPDAAVIETEDRNLTKYALLAAKHVPAVQMDKPGGQSQAEFDELIDYVKEKNIVFHTGYMYRNNAAIVKAKELIASGELGEVLCIEAHMNCIHKPQKRNWLADYKGGMMNFLGCHLVDVIYSIQGEPKQVIPLNKVSGVDGTVGEDIGMAVFVYDRGVSFAKTTAIEYGGFLRRQIVINCEKGTIEINPTEYYAEDMKSMYTDIRISRFDDATAKSWHVKNDAVKLGPADRYEPMFAEFAAIVRGETENPYSYEYERSLHKLLLKACGVK